MKVPFGDFTRRTDYQPSGGPTDGTLTLTQMWGAGPAGMPLTAQLTADAEHQLLAGRPDTAVTLLTQAYQRVGNL